MSKPHIPKPCHEDWNAMTPQSGGRHCDDCNKTVKDFTGWSNSEISTYLSEHSNQRICGRFTPDQLNEKVSPLHKRMHSLYRSTSEIKRESIRAIVLLFLSSFMTFIGCTTPSTRNPDTCKSNDDDSVEITKEHFVMGMVKPPRFSKDLLDTSIRLPINETDENYEEE